MTEASGPPSSPAVARSSGTVTEYQLKVLVIGEPGVGKTSLVRQFVHGQFSAAYKVSAARSQYLRDAYMFLCR